MLKGLIIGLLLFLVLLFIGNIGWGVSLFTSVIAGLIITYL
jgi:hypothetical protein